MSGHKRDIDGRTKTELNDQDIISSLPEPLIIEILSRMEFKYAVKTCVLAKNWKNLWKRIKNIVLRHIYASFAPITAAMAQCTTTNMNRFCLDGHSAYSSVINRWISFAFQRNAQIMELTHLLVVPESVFQTSSVSTLILRDVRDVCLPNPVDMESLKTLCIVNPTLDQASFDNLLAGCKMLENLELDNVSNLHYFHINSEHVRRFKLVWSEDEDDIGPLEITAKGLQELELSAKLIANKCKLVDVSSLTKASVIINIEPEDEATGFDKEVDEINCGWVKMLTKLLALLANVVELEIGSSFLQVLSSVKLDNCDSPLFRCKHLSVETSLWKFDLLGIACILENAPELETLVIKVVPYREDEYCFGKTERLMGDGDPHLSMPTGRLMHLKSVKVYYSRYSCQDSTESNSTGECLDFEIVDYILRSAIVLEKLVLCSLWVSHNEWEGGCTAPRCAFEYARRLSSKLTASFLGETAAEWELKKSKNKFAYTFSDYASLLPTTE